MNERMPRAEVLRTKRTFHATQNPFDYNVQLYTMLTRLPSVGSYQNLGHEVTHTQNSYR